MAMQYISQIPRKIPEGKILVHNNVKPAHPLGMNGFRAWLDVQTDEHKRCKCGWADGLEHYRLKAPFSKKGGK
jgi:hypothetical protein